MIPVDLEMLPNLSASRILYGCCFKNVYVASYLPILGSASSPPGLRDAGRAWDEAQNNRPMMGDGVDAMQQ